MSQASQPRLQNPHSLPSGVLEHAEVITKTITHALRLRILRRLLEAYEMAGIWPVILGPNRTGLCAELVGQEFLNLAMTMADLGFASHLTRLKAEMDDLKERR